MRMLLLAALLAAGCTDAPLPGEGRWFLTQASEWACDGLILPPLEPKWITVQSDGFALYDLGNGKLGGADWNYVPAVPPYDDFDDGSRARLELRNGNLDGYWTRVDGLFLIEADGIHAVEGVLEANNFDRPDVRCVWRFTALHVE